MNDIVTADLSGFGKRELELAIELLNAYKEQQPDFLGVGLTINFNTHSGYVFLSDEDFCVGMLQDSTIFQWFTCGNCGAEGFDIDQTTKNDYGHENKPFVKHNGFCSEECENENS